jgi:peptidyl-prolyl cis-trans isomerase A (cyclophilin A)
MRILSLCAFAFLLAGCPSPDAKSAAPVKQEPAPNQFQVKFDTSKGPFTVEVHRDWAPRGADRFYELVESKYYDDARFFRVVRGFVVQWGLAAAPEVSARWRDLAIPDDAVKQSNLRGYLTYAKKGPATRTTQVFINLANNSRLDSQGFAPFAKVIEGMDIVDALYAGYGDDPQQSQISLRGNDYLQNHYPKLDSIKTARVLK